VSLKPGQSIELLSGAVAEGYARKPPEPESKPSAKPAVNAKVPASAPREAGKAEGARGQRQETGSAVRPPQGTAGANAGTAPSSPPPIAQ